jgi:hypothetical protein
VLAAHPKATLPCTLHQGEGIGRLQDRASLINQAYSTLRCPYARATYMLHRMGVSLEDQTSDQDSNFMMQVMRRACTAARKPSSVPGACAIASDND